jgi:hypothetical protein
MCLQCFRHVVLFEAAIGIGAISPHAAMRAIVEDCTPAPSEMICTGSTKPEPCAAPNSSGVNVVDVIMALIRPPHGRACFVRLMFSARPPIAFWRRCSAGRFHRASRLIAACV